MYLKHPFEVFRHMLYWQLTCYPDEIVQLCLELVLDVGDLGVQGDKTVPAHKFQPIASLWQQDSVKNSGNILLCLSFYVLQQN